MARMVGSEHEMQEVFNEAGKKTVVVYFFDEIKDKNRKALNTIAKVILKSVHQNRLSLPYCHLFNQVFH